MSAANINFNQKAYAQIDMKRAEKIALLSKLFAGQADESTRQKLQRSSGPGMVVILFQPGDDTNPGPDDVVNFYHRANKYRCPIKI